MWHSQDSQIQLSSSNNFPTLDSDSILINRFNNQLNLEPNLLIQNNNNYLLKTKKLYLNPDDNNNKNKINQIIPFNFEEPSPDEIAKCRLTKKAKLNSENHKKFA